VSGLRSPLEQVPTGQVWTGVGGGTGVWFQELPFRAHLNLRSAASTGCTEALAPITGAVLPLEPNTASYGRRCLVHWLGPDEWLLIAAPTDTRLQAELEAVLAGSHYALTDLSGGQTLLRTGGPKLREVLASGCTLDLHPRRFGPGQCAQTLVAHVGALLRVAAEVEDADVIDIVVRRSFADHLLHWLLDASAEVGCALRDPA
jgi:sarcosine oxidase subunit gamma|tara:strand:- start:15230 stop:15838 length:609 start_codon:yes stop_codon:yes gene_type:complete